MHLPFQQIGKVLDNDPVSTYGFHRALVVGTARNASRNIKSDLLRVVNSLDAILPTSGFVVESDSDDMTVTVLAKLAKDDSRIRFISLGNVSSRIPDRIARLRFCRNAYIQEIRSNTSYKDCDLIVVADLDGINTKINTQSFELALSSTVKWDVIAANQSARYYDILALRHPLWSPNNWMTEMNWFTTFLGVKKAKEHSMANRMIRIPPQLPPIEVDSAFGGLSLLRRWTLEKCDYSEDTLDAADEIDHVTLNRKIRDQGGRIFIHPGFINSNWTAHSLNGSKFITVLKSISHLFPFRYLLPALRKLFNFIATRF